MTSFRRKLTFFFVLGSSLALAVALGFPAAAGATDRGKSHDATVHVVTSKKYGKILVDSAGRTLYMLTATRGASLACNTSCTGLWPPVTVNGKPHAGKGVKAKMLKTVKRGSKTQVTYDGHPLYAYSGDTGKGQVNGEGIASFGGTWYVLSTDGKPVKAALTSSSSGSSSSSSGGGW